MHADIRFESMMDLEWDFHGVDGDTFILGSGGYIIAFEVLEDPDDGYRSWLGEVRVREDVSDLVYFKQPLAEVKMREAARGDRDHEGYELVDTSDGHVWLSFGTDHTDDWYPCYVFHYNPKESK